MNYYALFYEVVDDFVARRAPFRQEHLRLANEARERGEIVFAGALAEPANGALIVFHADDKSKAESFARNDPYVQNGLVEKWEVRTWNVVVGNQPLPFSSTPTAGTILRRWSARATAAQLPQYLEYFAKNVLPELHRVPGYLGGTVTHRRLESEVEIVVETTWRSLESVRNFAGPDLEAAVVTDQAASLLKDFDRRAAHWEIAIIDGS
jgi:uncharacterized protein